MITRDTFKNFYSETMYPALDHLVKAAWSRVPKECTEIFRADNSTRAIEQVSGITGVGLFSEISEAGDIREDTPVEIYPKTFKHRKYGLAIPTSQEAVDDDQFGVVRRRHDALGRSGWVTIEVDVVSHFNNAFSLAHTGPDGVPLCSLSHPLPKAGGVQSNLLAVAADLDVSSLELAMTAWETMVDDTGLPAVLSTPRVIVAPANRWNVMEILKSSMRSDTANNTINALRYTQSGELPQPFIWRYLTDPDAWFLVGPKEETELIIYWRKRPYNRGWTDDRAEVGYLARRFRYSHGFAHYKGVFGTPGA